MCAHVVRYNHQRKANKRPAKPYKADEKAVKGFRGNPEELVERDSVPAAGFGKDGKHEVQP